MISEDFDFVENDIEVTVISSELGRENLQCVNNELLNGLLVFLHKGSLLEYLPIIHGVPYGFPFVVTVYCASSLGVTHYCSHTCTCTFFSMPTEMAVWKRLY